MSQQDLKINASPTKEFFISVLVRDVSLPQAINDLVDNCIDGARRLRPDGNYENLTIDLEVDSTKFMIMDNCGGIPHGIAKDYAFRFGRPEGTPQTDGSIGKFGVGMKRALFRIGKSFEIESTSTTSKWKMSVDVESWKSQKDSDNNDLWEFQFSQLDTSKTFPQDQCGTILTVTDLHPPIKAEFGLETFVTRLTNSLRAAHEQSIEQGLSISVNTNKISHGQIKLLYSQAISPIKITKTFPANAEITGSQSEVSVTIYAGISDSSLDDAGWYIICNGRQVLRAEKSRLTGWQDTVDNVKIPKAHQQFARFRGYVFFESNDAAALPWNTSKSGIDSESRIFQSIRIEMVAALRQIIDFLNKLDDEKSSELDYLQTKVTEATPTRLSGIPDSATFVYPLPAPAGSPKPETVSLQFRRPVDEVEFAKTFFSVGSARQAGEKTFDYFIQREREE